MRFMTMHKATVEMEAGAPPSEQLLAGMGPLMEDMNKAGVFVAGEGLLPTSHGVRVKYSGGGRTITHGPLTGNELLDRYLIVNVRTVDEAIEWADRFAGGADTEIDVRPVCEPWDLGFMPKPEGLATTRFMILHKGDSAARPEAFSAGAGLPGELLASEALQPSAKSRRLFFKDGKRTVVDGPFAESKEMIAGFCIMDVASIDEAINWTNRFAALFDEIEIDVRPMY